MNIVPDEKACEAAWVGRAVALLEESAETLDATTLSRLNRARHKALARRRPLRRAWLAGGGIAAAAAFALLLAVGVGHRVPVAGSAPVADPGAAVDADPLASEDNLDLYENLDFYAWLDAQQDGNG